MLTTVELREEKRLALERYLNCLLEHNLYRENSDVVGAPADLAKKRVRPPFLLLGSTLPSAFLLLRTVHPPAHLPSNACIHVGQAGDSGQGWPNRSTLVGH